MQTKLLLGARLQEGKMFRDCTRKNRKQPLAKIHATNILQNKNKNK